MTTILKRSLIDGLTFVVREPLTLAMAQPHQVLISCASVALMAQFASSSGIVAPAVGYALAVGVEWAYLRGLVSDSKAPTQCRAWLNCSASAVVVLWGCLWCMKRFGVIDESPIGWGAVGLAVAHVLPIAWLSLCSAMSHRAMIQAEATAAETHRKAIEDEARLRRDAENALQLERERKIQEIEIWTLGRKAMQEVSASQPNATSPHIEKEYAQPKLHQCASCGASLTVKQYAAARRWGHCANCKGK